MLDSVMHHDPRFKVQKADVFGDFDHDTLKKLGDGMVVARSEQKCPVFGDTVPYKSVTVVFDADQEADVAYWLAYVHGGPYARRKVLEDGRVALRSDYQAW